MTADEDLAPSETIGPTPTRPAFVRPANPDDEPALRRLRRQAFDDLGAARGGAMYLERDAAELPELQVDWSGATRRAWLGGIGNVEVGYLLGSVVAVRSGANLGVIEGIYVDREARACGIGELMMSAALAWFRAHNCVGVEATALPGERDTKNFFEEHGLTARLIIVYRSLTEDGAGRD